jgi:hypothetical protein
MHGVAGAQTITVYSAMGKSLGNPLKVLKVDIEHDLALLWSKSFSRAAMTG